MNTFIVAILFGLVSYEFALDCINNPCELGGYFTPAKGYLCIQATASEAWCTCPDGAHEVDKPCRVCDRSVCDRSNSKFKLCLETSDFGSYYACACDDGSGGLAFTLNNTCDSPVTVTTPGTGSSTAGLTPPPCRNGGVEISGTCNCPSGYHGSTCENKNDTLLCDNIVCKNGGVCALRSPSGPLEAVCLCKYGTGGTYCELNGTLGSCTPGLCTNGGSCSETTIGSTTFAYCKCRAGYSGPKCQTSTFTCPGEGLYIDINMFEQGMYFSCKMVGSSLVATQLSCPKGLRFSQGLKKCTN